MKKPVLLILLALWSFVFFLPAAYSFTLSNYTSYPQPFPYILNLISPVLADIDGNTSNGLEIAIAGYSGMSCSGSNPKIYLYYKNGSSIWVTSGCVQFSSLAAADLDGDPSNGLEIVLASFVPASPGAFNTLYAYYSNLTVFKSASLSTGNYTLHSPALGDIDKSVTVSFVILRFK